MTQHPTSKHFKDNAHRALQNAQLQKALGHTRTGFIERRAQAAGERDVAVGRSGARPRCHER